MGPTEVSPHLTYRICLQMWFSHIMVGAEAQSDVAHTLPQHSQVGIVA